MPIVLSDGASPHRIPVHIFISYAREDAEAAGRLQFELLRAGAASVWIDRKNIEGGDDWKQEIKEGLVKTQVVLALLTPHSVDPARRWIRYEHSEAMRLLRPVIPLMISDCELPVHLQDTQYVEFRGGWNEGLVSLLNAIGKITLRAGQSDRKFTEHAPPVGRSFLGREDDIRAVFGLIQGEYRQVATGRRSIAIQGMGGTGKTMLAEELLRRLSARYPGGVTVEQRGQRPEPAQAVLQKWAKCILGEFPHPQWTVVDVRSELQKRFGELLILIDDVSERDFDDVAQLLKALPPDATRIMTTRSKEIEALGAVVYPLSDFGEDDALLLLRHRLQGKGAEPDEGLLKELIELVGGHALSLELMAGRCKNTLDLPGQVRKLESRLAQGAVDRLALNVLGTKSRGRKDFSVAVSLEDSYAGLLECDQAEGTDWARRFRALGMFPDNARMDRRMLAAVWGDADSDEDAGDDALDGLFGRAMINRDGSTGLYFSHPLLRAYAQGHLKAAPDEAAAVRDRYAECITRQADSGFQAPPQEWSAMEVFRPHILFLAVEFAESIASKAGPLELLSRPETQPGIPDLPPSERAEFEKGLAFALAVRPYVARRPETGDRGLGCLRLGLACARALHTRPETIRFLATLGQWYEQKEPHLAERFYEGGLAAAEAAGDRNEWASIQSYNGELQRKLSRPQKALEILEQALAVHRERNNRAMEALTLRIMGETHWRLGRHEEALELHRSALDIFVSINDRSGQGDILNKIGSVRFNQGFHEDAIRLFAEALQIHREVGNRSMEAEDLNDMGISYRYLGDYENSLPRLIDALMLHRSIGSRRLQAISMCNIASVYIAKGLFPAAAQMAGDALALAREMDDLATQGWALSYKGIALQNQGNRDDALELFREAVDRSREVGEKRGEAGHLWNLGSLYNELGRRDEALDCLRQAVTVMERSALAQAFGGRRLADFKQLVAELELRNPAAGPA